MGRGLAVMGVPVMGGGVKAASMTVTTTGAQTLTFQALNVATGKTVVVNWGDGSSDAYTGSGTRTHNYAGAGTWTLTINNPLNVIGLNLQDAKLGWVAGTLSRFKNLTLLNMTSCPGLVVSAGEVGLLTKLTSLTLHTMANCTVGAGEIVKLTALETLYLRASASFTVGAAEIGVLTSLTTLYINVCGNVAFQTGLANLLALTALTYRNNLTQAQSDSLLTQIYAAFPTRTGSAGTIDMGTTNAAPTGTLEAPADCGVLSGKNRAYELVNDSCGVSSKHWTTVTITA